MVTGICDPNKSRAWHIDKLDIGKLETFLVDLNKLSDVKNEVIKKTVHDELVKKLMLFKLLILVT